MKKWYSPRGWWAIGGAVVVGLVVIGVVVLAQPAAKGPGTGGPSDNSSSNPPAANAVGSGYLAKGSNAVIFIQWTQSAQHISGSAQVETLSGTPPNASVSTQTISVAGQLNGSTITLSFNGGTKVFGTLSGGSFTVNFPQSDGSLSPVTFTAATATQFNQALSNLQGNTGSADQSAAAAQNIAAQQAAIDKAAQNVEGDLSGLKSDAASLSSDLGGFTGDLAQEKTDLATVATQEQTVNTESQNGTDNDQVCSDSDTDESDADTVGSDGDTVSSTADTISGDISTLRNDISRTQQDLSALQSAQAQQPSYKDGAPLQSTVNQAVAVAQAAITSAFATANADMGQANSYETQAYNDAVAAAKAGSCSPPATEYTQPTIS
jgi:hypothetical protein